MTPPALSFCTRLATGATARPRQARTPTASTVSTGCRRKRQPTPAGCGCNVENCRPKRCGKFALQHAPPRQDQAQGGLPASASLGRLALICSGGPCFPHRCAGRTARRPPSRAARGHRCCSANFNPYLNPNLNLNPNPNPNSNSRTQSELNTNPEPSLNRNRSPNPEQVLLGGGGGAGGSYGTPDVVCSSAQDESDCEDGGPEAERCRSYTFCAAVDLGSGGEVTRTRV